MGKSKKKKKRDLRESPKLECSLIKIFIMLVLMLLKHRFFSFLGLSVIDVDRPSLYTVIIFVHGFFL